MQKSRPNQPKVVELTLVGFDARTDLTDHLILSALVLRKNSPVTYLREMLGKEGALDFVHEITELDLRPSLAHIDYIVPGQLDALVARIFKLARADEGFDARHANSEGWGLVKIDGRYQLQRLDSADHGEGLPFESDADAIMHVARLAAAGSAYHLDAIARIGSLANSVTA